MVSVEDILRIPALKLDLHAGEGHVDAPVRSAHVSELEDPTPWLQGGEFLMTTTMALDPGPNAIESYLHRLKEADVSALAIGLGTAPCVDAIPAATVHAARAIDLPLISVPAETPFIAVTKAVFAELAAEQYAELGRTLAAQQKLLKAVSVHKGGFQAIADVLHDETGQWVAILDRTGALISHAPTGASRMLKDVVADFGTLKNHDLHSSTAINDPHRSIVVHPLGVGSVRGFLVCSAAGSTGTYERVVNAAATAVLSIEAELIAAEVDAKRLHESVILKRLISGGVSRARAEDLLSDLGLPYDRLCMVAMTALPADFESVLEQVTIAVPDVRAAHLGDRLLALLVSNPHPDLGELLSRALEGVPIGLGGIVAPEFAGNSLRQARYALQVGRRAGKTLVDTASLGSARLLLGMADREWLTAYADTTLSAIDTDDAESLMTTLRAFLEANGIADLAASRLGIHRHTLRRRIGRIESLTGRDLQVSHDRLDLWLALEAREMSTVAFEDLARDSD